MISTVKKVLYEGRHLTEVKNMELKNIILLISGEFISVFGTRIYNFAISYYILQRTGSALAFSTSLAIGVIPRILISPFAGAVVDALDRKSIVILMDLGRWIVLLLLYFIGAVSHIRIIDIYITILILNTIDIFFNIAAGSSIPNIVHKNNIVNVNSMKQTVSSIGSILAPTIGGVAISFIDIRYFILANGMSFLLSGMSQYFINYNINDVETTKVKKEIQGSMKAILFDMKESIKYIKTQSLIIILTIYSMLGNFLMYLGFIIPIPYLVLKVFKLGSVQYGIIQGATSVGAIIISIVLSTIPLPEKKYKLFKNSSLFFCVTFLLLAMGAVMNILGVDKSVLFMYMMLVTFLVGAAIVLINVPVSSIQQEKIENRYLGRVLGFQGTFESLITPAAMLLSGALLGEVESYFLPLISGIIFIILIIIICSRQTMKDL